MKYEQPKETAKRIRAELKKAFPGQKFSITSRINGYTSKVSISWADGPELKEVREIVGEFEPSGDKYQNGADFIFISRDVTN